MKIKNYFKLIYFFIKRGFRKWWSALPSEKKTIFINHLKNHRLRYGSILGGSGLISGIYYQTHIQETPITHRKRFMLFSNAQLKDIEKLGIDQVMICVKFKYFL